MFWLCLIILIIPFVAFAFLRVDVWFSGIPLGAVIAIAVTAVVARGVFLLLFRSRMVPSLFVRLLTGRRFFLVENASCPLCFLLLAAGNIFVRKYPAAAGAFRWLLVLYGLLILIHFLIWLLAVFIQSLIIHVAKPPCFRLSQTPHPDSCCSCLITVFIISAIYEDK